MAGVRSRALFKEARSVIPGGVNSPVRAFKAVGGDPLFISKGSGCRIRDEDGRRYIDYVASWGPLILGHARPGIVKALGKAIARGTTFGAPTEAEVRLARRVRALVPSIEKVRLVSSGTEAVMSAVRVARGFTGRDLAVKFEGCYHGHSDGLLSKAGSGVATLGIPDSAGVPAAIAALTATLPYNDTDAFQRFMAGHGDEVAVVLVEPVAGNMGVVPPAPGFLETLRSETQRHGALLLFDEVITGFRLAPGGAQQVYGIRPDLTTLGKVLGGGMPLAAYGGRADVMDLVAPEGPVYQAGTLSGNPIAVIAGIETLSRISRPSFHDRLEQASSLLEEGLVRVAREAGVPVRVNRVGSMFTVFFTETAVVDYASARTSDTAAYGRWFRTLLNRGVYFPPSQFEAAFVSAAHKTGEINTTIAAAGLAFRRSK